ncbi:MAG: hypothetical protein RIS64_3413 [Bacteroidota bacterium]|jgi:uncharacterized protein (TIGR02646 family)
MRPINHYFDDIPSEMQTVDYQNQLKKLLEKVARGNKIKTSEDIKGYATPEVKTKLEMIFHKKCAFCESSTKSGAVYDTEHFRPKKIYYWLAYEWSNFLLSCQRCNREYKGSNFPLEKVRAKFPSVDFNDTNSVTAFAVACHLQSKGLEEAEGRLLLHPVLDDPAEHLEFKANGEVTFKSKKGEKSIQFYGLNNREKRLDLIAARKKVIETVELRWLRAVGRYEKYRNKVGLYDDLLDIQAELAGWIAQSMDVNSADSEPYMGVITACLKNFKVFFLPLFANSPYKSVLQEVLLQIEKDREAR